MKHYLISVIGYCFKYYAYFYAKDQPGALQQAKDLFLTAGYTEQLKIEVINGSI